MDSIWTVNPGQTLPHRRERKNETVEEAPLCNCSKVWDYVGPGDSVIPSRSERSIWSVPNHYKALRGTRHGHVKHLLGFQEIGFLAPAYVR